jgi:hypothetical protein
MLSTRVALLRAKATGLDAVVASDVLLTSDDARAAHAMGLELFAWFPFSETIRADTFAVTHLDGIVSDHPTSAASRRVESPPIAWEPIGRVETPLDLLSNPSANPLG